MKVVLIATGSRPIQPSGAGGTEKDLYHLNRHLSQLGCDVSVVDIKADIPERQNSNTTIQQIWNPPLADSGFGHHLVRIMTFALLATLRLRHLIKRERIDLVHTHSQFPGAAILLAKRLFRWKMPLIHTIHNSYLLMEPNKTNRFKHVVELFVLKKADHVIVETETGCKQLTQKFGIDSNKITIIPEGLDVESFSVNGNGKQAGESSKKTVLYVSRVCPRKNQMGVIKAMPKILAEYPETEFKFVGPIEDKAYFKSLQGFIFSRKLSQQVGFAGELSGESLYKEYRDATIFVFPTLYETQGVVLLEAMVAGLPVIASKIGPIEDVVKLEEGSAILIDPNNPDEIADAITRVLEDESLRKELSAKGRKLVSERFRWEQIAEKILKVYGDIATETRTGDV